MPDWAAFAVATVALTAALLFFARRSQRTLDRVRIANGEAVSADGTEPPHGTEPPDGTEPLDEAEPPHGTEPLDETGPPDGTEPPHGTEPPDGNDPRPSDHGDVDSDTQPTEGSGFDRAVESERRDGGDPHEPVLTTPFLLVSVTVSQGVALIALVVLAWWADIPASAFGLGAGWDTAAVGVGTVAGVVLYAGNEAATRLGDRVGAAAPERLREAMAPTDARGWILLIGLTLPVIAVFEEALFRGALIGVVAVGFAVDPWILAVGSSVVFGLGHGAQGQFGVVVTGLLGFALAVLFVRTGSLLVVIVAHYAVNVLEFLVREGPGYDRIVPGVTPGRSR